MKLRIKSDGTCAGTEVQDENGNRVDWVRSISWSITSTSEEGRRARAVIVIDDVELDAEAEFKAYKVGGPAEYPQR